MNYILQVKSMAGDAEKYIMLQKDALKSALEKLLLKKKVKSLEDLTSLYQVPGLFFIFFSTHSVLLSDSKFPECASLLENNF